MDVQAVSQRAMQYLESWLWKSVMQSSMDSCHLSHKIQTQDRASEVWLFNSQLGLCSGWCYSMYVGCCLICIVSLVLLKISLFCFYGNVPFWLFIGSACPVLRGALLCFSHNTYDRIHVRTKLIHN